MGFRFQRRIGIGQFGRINISKSGVSLSEGVKGFHITLGKTPRLTIGLPGSGLSYTTTLPRGRRRSATPSTAPSAPRSGWAILGWVVVLLAAYVMIAIGGGH